VDIVQWKASILSDTLGAGHAAVRVTIKGVTHFYIDDGCYGHADHVFVDAEIDREKMESHSYPPPYFKPPRLEAAERVEQERIARLLKELQYRLEGEEWLQKKRRAKEMEVPIPDDLRRHRLWMRSLGIGDMSDEQIATQLRMYEAFKASPSNMIIRSE
jgi:hypothetical protein